MAYLSIGDMAQNYTLRHHNAQLKSTLNRLSEEVVTGEKKDTGAALGGDFSAFSGINRSLTMLESYKIVTSEATLALDTMQASLGTIQSLSDQIGATILSSSNEANPTLVDAAVADASVMFDTVISALNTNAAGQYLFSGIARDTAPLPTPDDLLAALTTEIAGATTAQEVVSRVSDWFDAPPGGGGFLDTAYQGDDSQPVSYRVADSEVTQITSSAADPRLRDVLKGFAIAALTADGLFAGNAAMRGQLAAASGEAIMTGNYTLTSLVADIGAHQGRVADAATRNAAEGTALQIARNGLVAADPYETASALEAMTTQLETLYTLTGRLSRLTLADYI
ncbi:flagellar hook protein [Thioclava dalianensis]|uniref:Flagellar hook protein n=1 Tax=Thioclava dalianensis TaxID=1185766 RepID=A0A074TEZ9_9RHOB|nr:flagellin [Thioclava dalianensis]KEP70296.1 flagellar hook protein [Thioclava dalianensis]SFN34074.1 flagellar hook-associated protein 3 FlgL [Thioclava dalianensis]